MGDTTIEWTEKTWNPVRGCSRISEGCRNCYAERVAARFSGKGLAYEGLAKATPAGPRWTGKVQLVEEHLRDPLRWRAPQRVFVNSMSDLFHEALDVAQILRVFDVIRECAAGERGHTFQVLTKRADRMRAFASRLDFDHAGAGRLELRDRGLDRWAEPISFMPLLKNTWLGVSVEDQATADARVPELLGTPAFVRWVSVEPQIGPIDLTRWLKPVLYTRTFEKLQHPDPRVPKMGGTWYSPISWVVVGGESGPGARPFQLKWARDLIEQCHANGVAVFVKQLGAVPIIPEAEWRNDGRNPFTGLPVGPSPLAFHLLNGARSVRERVPEGFVGLKLASKGGETAEWPADLDVRDYPDPAHLADRARGMKFDESGASR